MAGIYSIDAGLPFVETLVNGVIERFGADDDPLVLSRLLMILPTNRACRQVREMFARIYADKPLLLPRMVSLGNLEEEDLSLLIAAEFGMEALDEIAPAIHPLRRQILLACLIQKMPGRGDSFSQAMQLAQSLGHFMDQVHTEGLGLEALDDLVPDDLASHWQITLDFLKILKDAWPLILEEEGCIDGAKRRDLLIRALGALWRQSSPDFSVLAAGSTGSIPSTRDFLSIVQAFSNGYVVLPGLDRGLDTQVWENLPAFHPQVGLKKLLACAQVSLAQVEDWAEAKAASVIEGRHALARHVMCGPEEVSAWQDLKLSAQDKKQIESALDGVSLYETANEREEAAVIASIFRHTLETEGKTATLISPDRLLARRVVSECQRWGIDVDDSAGEPFAKSKIASFLKMILEAVKGIDDPVCLLAMVKHTYFMFFKTDKSYLPVFRAFEKNVLRDSDTESYKNYVLRVVDDSQPGDPAYAFCYKIIQILFSVHQTVHLPNGSENKFNMSDLVKIHLDLYGALSGQVESDMSLQDAIQWPDEHSHYAVNLFESLLQHSVSDHEITFTEYISLIDILFNSQALRPRYGVHPRLNILGQLEARMIDADVIILAGLNEGTWPADAVHDPWMSHYMRGSFGLPGNDQAMSLSAHDFVQGFCHCEVYLTRSVVVGGAPSLPSRWLQKIDIIVKSAGFSQKEYRGHYYQMLLKMSETIDQAVMISRPEPRPPVSARPVRFSATHFEKWLENPYWLYASKILRLKKLADFSDNRINALRGIILHYAVEIFASVRGEDGFYERGEALLMERAQKIYQKKVNNPSIWAFWEPQFHNIFEHLLRIEKTWSKDKIDLNSEAYGVILWRINDVDYEISCKADRLDLFQTDPAVGEEKKAAILDYKTGGYFTDSNLKTGKYPQLLIEALILNRGGFEAFEDACCAYLGYRFLKMHSPEDLSVDSQDAIDDLLHDLEKSLEGFFRFYQNENHAYLPIPHPARSPRFDDYHHLARVQEWSKNEFATEDSL